MRRIRGNALSLPPDRAGVRGRWSSRLRGAVCLAAIALWIASAPRDGYEPPRYSTGLLSPQPPMAQDGGFVVLEAEIAASGIVTDVVVLDDAPPFTESLSKDVKGWRFRPAVEDGRAVSSKAIVVGLFRPPVLLGGDVPDPVSRSRPSDEVPYPTTHVTPSYPPNALYEGTTFMEVEVDETGDVRHVEHINAEAAYDELAFDAVRQFRFRPARYDGNPITSFALVVFGFRQPVTDRRRPRR